jgi:C4-dicarboxylate-specific signal transduction histidine kinase
MFSMEYAYLIPYIVFALGLVFFIAGILQRKSMRKELQDKDEAFKLKENEFNELRLLAASVTHEINNALTVIMGRLSILIKKNDDPEQDAKLANMYATAERIAASVSGLRQVIYPDKFEQEEMIELPALMEDVSKLTGQRLRNHGIELKLKGFEHKVIKGRKGQLEQLIINLLNQSVERLLSIEDKWIQMVAVLENGKLNIYFMDSSSEVGDKITHKQFSDILESNHGHLTVNQNNLILELPQMKHTSFHY